MQARLPAIVAVAAMTLLVACEPAASFASGTADLPELTAYADVPVPEYDPWQSLHGDAGFERSGLDPATREWYDRLWAAIETTAPQARERVQQDDLYIYGRWLFQYHHALLLGLRVTGDLRFLDAVDATMQGVREQLRDGWCGNVDPHVDNGSYGETREDDGYLNLRWRNERGIRHYCRDTGDLDEALAHGNLAMVAFAYQVNRDENSPSGVDYGERADFWLDYLREHFEAKWRERSGTVWPDMDFIDLKFCHTYHQFILYHYFVGRTLQAQGDDAAGPYLRQAMRLSDAMVEVPYAPGEHPGGFVDVETPLGEAVVYSFGAPGVEANEDRMQGCPVTYARYALTSMLVLRLEAFHVWDDDLMRKLATGLAHFVLGDDPIGSGEEPLAPGVSGEARVQGMPRATYGSRGSVSDFAVTPFAAYARWDESGRLRSAALEAYELTEATPDAPERVFLPAGLLFLEGGRR